LWLAPVQAIILPITDRHIEYARSVKYAMTEAGLRADVDERSESVGRKIRDAEIKKVPYMLVVGDREQDARQVSVRRHHGGDEGALDVEELVERLRNLVQSRSIG
jgi:threonyl-tRNA synthetase